MKKIKFLLKKVAPWVMVVLIFAYLFNEYPPQKIYNALKFINFPLFIVVALGYFICMYLLDTYSTARVLNRFGHEGTFKELLPVRGMTYLVMVVNYAAAQAAFAFYQYRKHGLAISRMLGIFGIMVVTDLYILATLAFITTFFSEWPFTIFDINIAQFVRIFTVVCYLVFILNLFLWRGALGKSRFTERLKKKKILELMANTSLSDYMYVVMVRLPVHAFIMCGMYVAVLTFNAHIDFIKILSNIPLIFFIGALPITPGGMGTSNAVLVELFKPFVQSIAITEGLVSAGDLLFSFSLIWLFANYIMKAITGVICLKFVSKDLFKPTVEADKLEADEAALPIQGPTNE